jgi:hypothetical protein
MAKSTVKPPIHIGELIKEYLKSKRIFKSALARKINKRDTDILRYQKSVSLKTEVLFLLSDALEHNFFADIATLLPSHYSSTTPVDTSKDEIIENLTKQIELLKAREEVLLEALKGK